MFKTKIRENNTLWKNETEDIRIWYHDNTSFHFWKTGKYNGLLYCITDIVKNELSSMSDNCGKNTLKILQKLFHSKIELVDFYNYFQDDCFDLYCFTDESYITPFVTLSRIRISDFDDTVIFTCVDAHGINHFITTTVQQIMKCSSIEKHCYVKLKEYVVKTKTKVVGMD